MENEIKINDGHYLELMDRMHIVICTLQDHILHHPLTENEIEITKKVEEAVSSLWDAYQLVGNKIPE